jgi:intracellular septation protein
MKTLLDFIPILLFFGAYKLHAYFGIGKEEAIYFATPVLMAATALQMAVIYAIDRKLTTLHKVTLALILVFGSITLAVHDKRYIMWKPTVLYAGFAIAMAVMLWGMRKSFFKTLLGSQVELPDHVWHKFSVAWIGFFVFLAASNAYVVMYYSEEAWIDFKIWGYGFWLVFFTGLGFYIAPHIRSDEADDAANKEGTP